MYYVLRSELQYILSVLYLYNHVTLGFGQVWSGGGGGGWAGKARNGIGKYEEVIHMKDVCPPDMDKTVEADITNVLSPKDKNQHIKNAHEKPKAA